MRVMPAIQRAKCDPFDDQAKQCSDHHDDRHRQPDRQAGSGDDLDPNQGARREDCGMREVEPVQHTEDEGVPHGKEGIDRAEEDPINELLHTESLVVRCAPRSKSSSGAQRAVTGVWRWALLEDRELAILDNLYQRGLYRITVFVDAEITAVSYTHLRAHETVLDLVCRLLLEKKKKNKKKII